MICGHVVLVNNYYYYSMKLKMDWTLINHVSHINSRSYTYIMYKCDWSSNNFIPGEVAFDQWTRAPQAWGDHRSHVTILHLPLLQKQHCPTCHPHQSLRETTKGDHSQPTVKGDHLCRSLQQVWPSQDVFDQERGSDVIYCSKRWWPGGRREQWKSQSCQNSKSEENPGLIA